MTRYLIPALLLLIPVTASMASDGRFEINQHCVALGCFPGDSPGLPVTITQPGSYILTSPLTTSDVDQDLIDVRSHNVSVDLNGFSLSGPVECSAPPVVCSDSGSSFAGRGIVVATCTPYPCRNVQVRNGTIRGMGSNGVLILFSKAILLENLILTENAGAGIAGTVGIHGVPEGLGRSLIAYRNGSSGIDLGGSGGRFLITDSYSASNGFMSQNFGACSNSRYINESTTNPGQVAACVSYGNNYCTWDGGEGPC